MTLLLELIEVKKQYFDVQKEKMNGGYLSGGLGTSRVLCVLALEKPTLTLGGAGCMGQRSICL